MFAPGLLSGRRALITGGGTGLGRAIARRYLQLGARIAARPQAYPPGSQLEVQAATAREALIWRFQVEGPEELQLPGGHQATLRLVRRPEGEFEPRLEVWLAPGLDYAPVRMRLTQHNGDHLDYRWSGTDRP